jgi:hypothetical protein
MLRVVDFLRIPHFVWCGECVCQFLRCLLEVDELNEFTYFAIVMETILS